MTTHPAPTEVTSSLSDVVAAIAPTIPPGLISAQALNAISSVAETLPLTLGSTIGFERPLHATAGEADFFLRVSGALGKSFLSGQTQNKPILEQLRLASDCFPPGYLALWKNPVWQRLRQLAHYWAAPDALLHQIVEDVWLEFDIDSDVESDDKSNSDLAAKTIPLPSSFVGLRASNLPTFSWVRQVVLPMLIGNRLSPITDDTLLHCFNSIQPPANLFQVGVLSGRSSPANNHPPIRLYIQDLGLDALRTLITRLNWSGDCDLLIQALSQVCGKKGRFSLQIEIQETLSPIIAVECYFQERSDWQGVLDRLVNTGFCVPQLASDLLKYPGYVREQDRVAPFPELLTNWSGQLAPYRECLLVKRLAYLKFTCQPGQPLLAKAYLGVSPTWVDGRYLVPGNHTTSGPGDEVVAVQLCKALIQELDYGEIDVDGLFPAQRSRKAYCLRQALEAMCVGG